MPQAVTSNRNMSQLGQRPNVRSELRCPLFPRLRCKSRKLQGDEFFVKTRKGKRSPIRIISIALPKSPASSKPDEMIVIDVIREAHPLSLRKPRASPSPHPALPGGRAGCRLVVPSLLSLFFLPSPFNFPFETGTAPAMRKWVMILLARKQAPAERIIAPSPSPHAVRRRA